MDAAPASFGKMTSEARMEVDVEGDRSDGCAAPFDMGRATMLDLANRMQAILMDVVAMAVDEDRASSRTPECEPGRCRRWCNRSAM